MKFILGKKLDMTQVYGENGAVITATVVEVEPNIVIQIRTKDKDGYEAVQVGTGTKKKIAKPQQGQFKDLGKFRYVREFKALQMNEHDLKVGDILDLAAFAPGDEVKVSGYSKGKGFAGAMKRHGFSGMPMGHGHKHVARHIGSIGQRFPQHTLKGKKMAGRMGNIRVTVRGLKVVHVDKENGLIALSGPVPGNKGGLLAITTN
ncbi:MAG: 50S ribosomal protein L3 [Patescibacteria group bacterium]